MKIKTYTLLAATLPIAALLSSCSLGIKSAVTKSYPPLNPAADVKVFPLEAPSPPNAEQLGTVRIYDGGTFDCGYDVVVAAAKTEARKAGGNALKITEHLTPSIWSSCHQIRANILRLDTAALHTDTAQQKNPSTPAPAQHGQANNNKQYKAFYLSAEGGWSWRTNKIDPNLNSFEREYLSNLKSGHHYGFSAMYYLNRGIGIGLMYDNHVSANSVEASAIDSSTGQTVTGELRDDISISLIAASVDFRGISKSGRNSFHFKISMGYSGYRDDGGFINYGTITGSTFGISYDMSYDINLVDHWYFAPSVAYRAGILTSYDVTVNNNTQHVNLDKDNYEGLSRFDLSAGLRYKW